MTHRLAWMVVTLLGTGLAVAACSSDNADGSNGSGAGEGGETATSGSSSGGSSAGKAGGGMAQGGSAGSDHAEAGQNAGGTGPELGGAPGAAGAPTLGGAPEMAGAAGATEGGTAGAPAIDYACTSNSLTHKVCSAQVAMNCDPATECSDCVASRNTDREPFADCAACLSEYDKYIQCGVDAFEAGHVADAFECVQGYGADLNDSCFPILDSAFQCQDYETQNGCPTSWPVN